MRRQQRLNGVTLHDPLCPQKPRCDGPVRCIMDVEAFVVDIIDRARLPLTQDDWEELTCEGIHLLYRLHSRYQPQREGYDKPGRFAAYANVYLPKKLSHAWHASQPNHVFTRANGWVVHDKALSLNTLLEEHDTDGPLSDQALHAMVAITVEDTHDPLLDLYTPAVTPSAGAAPSAFLSRFTSALRNQLETEHHTTAHVAWLRSMDYQRAQIVETLGVPEVEVRMAIERLKRIGKDLAA